MMHGCLYVPMSCHDAWMFVYVYVCLPRSEKYRSAVAEDVEAKLNDVTAARDALRTHMDESKDGGIRVLDVNFPPWLVPQKSPPQVPKSFIKSSEKLFFLGTCGWLFW